MHVYDRIEQRGCHVLEGLVAEDAGVVDDDVDPVVGIDRRLDDGLPALGGRHAVVIGDGLAAEVADFSGHRVGRAFVSALA